MSFFPGGLQPGYQVLWQPVAIQQIQSETIEQLRWENNMLKSQLESVMKVILLLSRRSMAPPIIIMNIGLSPLIGSRRDPPNVLR